MGKGKVEPTPLPRAIGRFFAQAIAWAWHGERQENENENANPLLDARRTGVSTVAGPAPTDSGLLSKGSLESSMIRADA